MLFLGKDCSTGRLKRVDESKSDWQRQIGLASHLFRIGNLIASVMDLNLVAKPPPVYFPEPTE